MASFVSVLRSSRRITNHLSFSLAKCLSTSSNLNAVQARVSRPEGKTTCTMIPGDGVGPELMTAVQEVFRAADVPIDFEYYFLSEVQPQMSAPVEEVAASVTKNGICLKGVLSTPYIYRGELQSLNMKLRRILDLFANVVHIKSVPGVKTRHKNLDFIIIREQIEGEYSALEHESVDGVVECLKIVTRQNSYRIAKFAFDFATKLGRKKVTAVHKANIMKLGDGLFLRCCQEVAQLYPKIEFNSMIIDNCTMQMVSHPNQFDVMVMPNLYGNIVDNLATGLVGGAGLVAGESFSSDCAVFEPGARHTFSEAVGKDVANPTAMLLSATNMLRHVNLQYYAKLIEDGIVRVLKSGKVRTKDLGGYASCSDFTMAVMKSIHV